MLMMRRLKAVVGQGGAVVVRDRVDYPEGTELDIDVHEPGADGYDDDDDLSVEEREARDAAIEKAWLRYKSGEGKTYSGDEVREMLRARR